MAPRPRTAGGTQGADSRPWGWIFTRDGVRVFVEGSEAVDFTGADRESVCEFVRRALVRLDYAGRIRANRTRGWSGATRRR